MSGSYSVPVKPVSKWLKPGTYRLEATLYGWNGPYSNAEIVELKTMNAPFLLGESDAVVMIELKKPEKP